MTTAQEMVRWQKERINKKRMKQDIEIIIVRATAVNVENTSSTCL